MNKLKIILAIILILIGVVGRFVLVSYIRIPNFEIITALALISGIYLGGVYSVAIPLSIIFLSDMVIGNNYIFIFTWTAFALIGLFGRLYGKSRIADCGLRITKNNFIKRITESIGLGIISSVFFYLFTNFGWWLMSGMYEYTFSGLMKCYYMGLPFFRNNLIGNLIFVPASIAIFSKIIYSAELRNIIVIRKENSQT
ncbi:MAG: DUF6580 family putative transport protein [Minisyncoccia bacterium]